jgi:enamine deaminase RidA (YjgF/YER057c/UK114 family)
MTRTIVRPEGMSNSPFYSHAIKKSGTPVFISGQISQDESGNVVGEGDPALQARTVLGNLKKVVESCGGTMEDIVKITIFTTDLAYRAQLAPVRSEFFKEGESPASTFLVVTSLADPRYLIEIEAVAMIE